MEPTRTIASMYRLRCSQPSDIVEHLPVLLKYATGCETITEFGVRNVVSTWAFAHARPKRLLCVDIHRMPEVDGFLSACESEGIAAQFILGNTLSIDIQHTDLLFIDTEHTYAQLKGELSRHHEKVGRFIILHDTETFRQMVPAISEFLADNPEWIEVEKMTNCNGLTVLSRKPKGNLP